MLEKLFRTYTPQKHARARWMLCLFGRNFNKFTKKANLLYCRTYLDQPVFLAALQTFFSALVASGRFSLLTSALAVNRLKRPGRSGVGVVVASALTIGSAGPHIGQSLRDPGVIVHGQSSCRMNASPTSEQRKAFERSSHGHVFE